ncbi:MAG: mercury methylation corrinoid protein HgcA [Planctomycetota bacterium]
MEPTHPSHRACCRGTQDAAAGRSPHWITGQIETPAGPIPQVATSMTAADKLGSLKARLAISRMNYSIEPGLYAVGTPTPESTVLVTANYKMSFDRLRRELPGRGAWIMVLDTKGINVWCAAGKGTFGTAEIVERVKATRLHEVVSHRTLVLPQLGAPGVAAHAVKSRSGFRVVYGPVRAADLPVFLDAGMKATPEMRRVKFTLADRLALVPIEMVMWPRPLLLVLATLFFLGGLGRDGYSFDAAIAVGGRAVLLCLLAFVGGTVLVPALLPWLPGRAFSMKGAAVGLLLAVVCAALSWRNPATMPRLFDLAAWVLILPAAVAFFAMNFTGASTYTSLSGVKAEMRVAVPAQIMAGVLGVGLWVIGHYA